MSSAPIESTANSFATVTDIPNVLTPPSQSQMGTSPDLTRADGLNLFGSLMTQQELLDTAYTGPDTSSPDYPADSFAGTQDTAYHLDPAYDGMDPSLFSHNPTKTAPLQSLIPHGVQPAHVALINVAQGMALTKVLTTVGNWLPAPSTVRSSVVSGISSLTSKLGSWASTAASKGDAMFPGVKKTALSVANSEMGVKVRETASGYATSAWDLAKENPEMAIGLAGATALASAYGGYKWYAHRTAKTKARKERQARTRSRSTQRR